MEETEGLVELADPATQQLAKPLEAQMIEGTLVQEQSSARAARHPNALPPAQVAWFPRGTTSLDPFLELAQAQQLL